MSNTASPTDAKSFVRIKDLELSKHDGPLDLARLKAIHAYIFQDSPDLRPGELRPYEGVFIKSRPLEAQNYRYQVHYASPADPHDQAETLDQKIEAVLLKIRSLEGLKKNEFCESLANIYSDLDYLHPFVEGNSRTLRSFTKEVAENFGYSLNWGTTNVSGQERDALYIARDLAVAARKFPGLNFERACKTPDRSEQETWLKLVAKFKNPTTLQCLIAESVQQAKDMQTLIGTDTNRVIAALKASCSEEDSNLQERQDRQLQRC